MITMHSRKRIDVLVDAPLCDWLVDEAAAAGIVHHSILPVASGTGRAGAWRDDGFGAVGKRIFLAVTGQDKAAALLERLAPQIERYGLVVTVMDVEVVRGERF